MKKTRQYGYSCWQQDHRCESTIRASTQAKANKLADEKGWVIGHHDGQAHYSCPDCIPMLMGVYGPIGGPKLLAAVQRWESSRRKPKPVTDVFPQTAPPALVAD